MGWARDKVIVNYEELKIVGFEKDRRGKGVPVSENYRGI